MSNPAYLWLTDANGSPIVGGSMVSGRLGANEIKAVAHHLTIPVSGNTGRLTGTRVHTPIAVQKEFDKTTPVLFRALCENQTLKSATIKMYQIDDAGIEREYFNIILEIELRYEAITWKHCDGNIVYRDAWNHMAIA